MDNCGNWLPTDEARELVWRALWSRGFGEAQAEVIIDSRLAPILQQFVWGSWVFGGGGGVPTR